MYCAHPLDVEKRRLQAKTYHGGAASRGKGVQLDFPQMGSDLQLHQWGVHQDGHLRPRRRLVSLLPSFGGYW